MNLNDLLRCLLEFGGIFWMCVCVCACFFPGMFWIVLECFTFLCFSDFSDYSEFFGIFESRVDSFEGSLCEPYHPDKEPYKAFIIRCLRRPRLKRKWLYYSSHPAAT